MSLSTSKVYNRLLFFYLTPSCLISSSTFFFTTFVQKWSFLREACSFLTLALIFVGMWITFRKQKYNPVHYYFILHFIAISLWPFGRGIMRESVRFILPILPFAFFYFCVALKIIFDRFSRKITYVVLVALLLSNAFSLPVRPVGYSGLQPSYKNYIILHNWMRDNLPQEGIIFSRKPRITYFYTYHQAIQYYYAPDVDKIWRQILDNEVKYIIVDEFSRETRLYLAPFIDKYRDRLKIVHKIGNTVLFEVNKG